MFDDIRKQTAFNRAQFYIDLTLPFYGYNREGAQAVEGFRRNWWRQGMMGGIKAQYDCVKAFSETDFTEDLETIEVPTLVMHGEDDQIVPFAEFGALVGRAAAACDLEGLSRPAARDADDACRADQRRPAGVHTIVDRLMRGQRRLTPGASQAWPVWDLAPWHRVMTPLPSTPGVITS